MFQKKLYKIISITSFKKIYLNYSMKIQKILYFHSKVVELLYTILGIILNEDMA